MQSTTWSMCPYRGVYLKSSTLMFWQLLVSPLPHPGACTIYVLISKASIVPRASARQAHYRSTLWQQLYLPLLPHRPCSTISWRSHEGLSQWRARNGLHRAEGSDEQGPSLVTGYFRYRFTAHPAIIKCDTTKTERCFSHSHG